MKSKLYKQLPLKAREAYDSAYEVAVPKYDEERANKIALVNARNELQKPQVQTFTYDFVADTASVSKGADGYSYVDYALSSNSLDAHGTKFDDFALTNMVDQINNEGLVGTLDDNVHKEWNELKAKGYSPEEIEEILQKRDTGIKAVSARILGNKVVARLRVAADKIKEVLKYKGASVEARVPVTAVVGNTFKQARLQGFVLTNTPSNPDAYRVE